ncbi:MAG: 2-oxo-3-hexenedioate decarboxylase [Betaproteobacteria bacterium]|nr:2-oxo-3-hexenedioate decarboxylase [Betaproteobacteria bacterium]
MKLDEIAIGRLAAHLDTCIREVKDTVKITDTYPEMDWDDAYAVQDALRERQIARGARVIGYKIGLTSLAKMKQMGVNSPVFGCLLDAHALPDGGSADTAALIHPKVEPEIAFVLERELKGPDCHIGAVLAATAFVLPGIEIIDSRYRDFKFDLKSVIADNTSAARFVIGGQPLAIAGADLRTIGIVLERNGESVAFGAGAAVLGNPAVAVAMLANHLAARGESIPAGAVILSGGITEAVAVRPGDNVTLRIHGMGSISVRF